MMNLSHSSRLALVALLVLVAAVAPAAGVSVEGSGVPDAAAEDSRIGAEQSTEFAFTDLYDQYDAWTLSGTTQLENATWTITVIDNRGNRIGERRTVANESFALDVGGNADTVQVRLEGRVPPVTNVSYAPPQTFHLARFFQGQEGGVSYELRSWAVRPYTPDSQQARQAIGAAEGAVSEARASGADPAEAQRLLDNAVSAFDNGNFGNAADLASQAEASAERAAQSQSRNSLLLKVGAGIVALLVVIGGVLWYLRNRQTYDKLG